MQETKTAAVGFRLSPQQEQLLATGPGATQCAALIDGPVDLERLRGALEGVVAQHEILRTAFVRPAGMRTAQQVIGAESAAAWSLEQEPSAAGLTAGGAGLDELMTREATYVLGLERGPLLRALLAGASEDSALLLLTACGACADTTSLLQVLAELCDLYRGAELSSDPLQYADYAEWRHALIIGEEPQADGLAFWRADAAERPLPPRVLFTRRASGGDVRMASAPLELREVGLEELQRAAIGAGVTVPVLLEAAWHALLARLSGSSELMVAGWCDGRAQPDLERAIGAYEQPVPIRSRFQESTTFAEIVDQVRRARAVAVRWQDCGDAEDLQDVAKQAVAGCAFHAVGTLSAPTRRILALRMAPGASPLTLALQSSESDLTGELVYDSLAVAENDARELAGRYSTLLHSALADTSVPVARLAMLEEGEREALLSAAGGDAAPPGSQTPVHERFAEQARLTPDRPAVIGASGSMSYAELDAAANRLANHLAQLGSVRQQPVGLCMERTPSMIVALMAILKAGGAYLPLNHEHPPARLSHQLRDAGAGLLLTETHLLASLPQDAVKVLCLDQDAETIATCSPESLGPLAAGEDLVYVMYTSGSTGAPKGVAVSHANLASYVASIAARLGIQDDSAGLVFGVVSAISTDLGNTSIFTPLITGGAVRLISAEASTDSELLAGELDGARLDVLKIAPSHLRALLSGDAAAMLPRRWLLVGGEALSWELVEQIRSLSSSCRILNHYGPTETTVGCATHLVEDHPRADSLTVPIGFPLASVRTYVLDRDLEPVPAGVPGELCIAGAGVASGYLGAGEESLGGFTADLFASGDSDAARMYRTGDRVRRLRDGAIEFLGRLDDQVKIRGFRIEPGEIETTLLAHDAVRQVAVCAEDDERGGLRLVAYVVSPTAPAVEELRAFLAKTLPDHMIPTAFRTVEALPLSASGKIDRRALAGMAEVQARREADYIAPRDEVEALIAKIWGELLGVERVGALDDFFALGGHSLLATQATMQIRRLYGDIPLRALLAAPTVAALAEVVRARMAGGGGQ